MPAAQSAKNGRDPEAACCAMAMAGAQATSEATLTREVDDGGYGLDPEKLWATVYFDDDEAVQLWREIADLPDCLCPRRAVRAREHRECVVGEKVQDGHTLTREFHPRMRNA